MLEKLHIWICVWVSLMMTILGIISGMTLYELGVRLIIIIITFYVLGMIIKEFLKKKVFVEKDIEEESIEENPAGEMELAETEDIVVGE